jgi:hypothetical protein
MAGGPAPDRRTAGSSSGRASHYGMEIWCLALDFIKAFDSADRELLWAYLEKPGVDKQLIHVCKKLYKRSTMDVEGISSFLSTIGVRQARYKVGR